MSAQIDFTKLKNLIKEKGYNKSSLSVAMGYHKSYIQSLEKCETARLTTIKKISKALGVRSSTIISKPKNTTNKKNNNPKQLKINYPLTNKKLTFLQRLINALVAFSKEE